MQAVLNEVLVNLYIDIVKSDQSPNGIPVKFYSIKRKDSKN